MPTAIRFPRQIAPSELDDYLAQGWRPLGQRIYTADYIQLEPGAIYSVVPTRLPLRGHEWGKRQRKLLRRNNELFQVKYGPAHIDHRKRRINQQYSLLHAEKTSEDLDIHLRQNGRRIFNTWNTEVYYGDRLVAFSFFDLGERAAYSKAGIYDPAFARYSLGLYTMLLEVEYCRQHDMQYFYPGYIAPENDLFDYKHRLGPLEFWDLQAATWRDFSAFDSMRHDPLHVVQQRLKDLQETLQGQHLASRRYEYLFYEIRLMYEHPSTYLDHPALLLVHCPGRQLCWVIIYEPHLKRYELLLTFFEQRVAFFDPVKREWPYFQYILKVNSLLHHADTPEAMAADLRQRLGHAPARLQPIEY